MKQHGFTLIEVLVVVVIIGVLTSVALPMYTRTIERSRAMEAMTNIKTINDAIYVYHADKAKCPTKFKQLVVTLPLISGSSLNSNSVSTKFFTFTLNGSPAHVPGTNCSGALATRREGGNYQYSIYNAYSLVAGKAAALSCTVGADVTDATARAKSQDMCESLGFYVPTNISTPDETETEIETEP